MGNIFFTFMVFVLYFFCCRCTTSSSDTTFIPKANMSSYFQAAVIKIKNASKSFGGPLTASLRKILDTSAVFAQCVHKCFIEKNSNGFCFDRKG